MTCKEQEPITEERRAFVEFAERLRSGENHAAQELLARYSTRIVALARQRLNGQYASKIDPDDILQSVFRTFFRRLDGGAIDLRDWASLTGLLSVLTLRNCSRKKRAFATAKRDTSLEVGLVDANGKAIEIEIPTGEPTPDEVVAFTELLEHLLKSVDDRDRQILEMILAGNTVEHTASQIRRSRRTVQRALARIRQTLVQDRVLSSYLDSAEIDPTEPTKTR